jgi:PPOX class probable F420-dependent enzyme
MADSVIDDDVRRLIDGRNVAHMATLSADGSPHVVPLWVATDGDQIVLVKVEGSVGLANIEGDRRVALSIAERGNQYTSAQVRGAVVAIERSPAAGEWLDRLARKYTGEDYPDNSIDVVLVRVAPRTASLRRIEGFDDTFEV